MDDRLPGPEKTTDWEKLVSMGLGVKSPTNAVLTFKRLKPRQRIVVMLAEAGWRTKDIATATGYTESRVSIILNSRHPALLQFRAEFASQVADRTTDTQMRFKLYANEMLDRLVTHARQDARPELSRLAARDILFMAGFTPVKKQFTMEAKLPVEELRRVVGAINEANEVVMRGKDWEVHEARRTA